MRIGFFTSEYVTESNYDGGLANYLFRVATALATRGHQPEVFVVASRHQTFSEEGVIVHRARPCDRWVPVAERWASRLTRRRWRSSTQMLGTSLGLRLAFLRRHRERPFDVLQIPDFGATGFALLIGRSPVPVVMRMSSDERLCRETYGNAGTADARMAERLSRWMRKQCAGVYAPSRCLADHVKRMQELWVDVLEPPFALDQVAHDRSVYLSRCGNRPYLLFHGTLGRLKGAEVLADALATILPMQADMQMVLVGKDVGLQGVAESAVDYICARVGVHAVRVQYLGRLPHAQLYPLIAGARGCVLPSLVDNLPNACMEAMAFGRPVIGTAGASFEELIEDGVSGVLVPPRNPAALAEAMLRLWRGPDAVREQMGRAALERIRRLDPAQMVPNLERYLGATIDSWRRGGTHLHSQGATSKGRP